jgi:RimJ/RimL family protein N-acetyltransferase
MVKKSNIASLRAFENASFEKEGVDEFPGEPSFRLVYRKKDSEKHAYHHQ